MYDISFASPWVLLLWPLPLLLYRLMPAAQTAQMALRIPFYYAFKDQSTTQRDTLPWWAYLAFALIWTSLLIAAARPQTLGEPMPTQQAGRNIMLAIDISQSMALTDLDWQGKPASRLQVVKGIASEFIDSREGDRLGLILFGSHAYLQTPLTFDRQIVKRQLLDASIGLAGQQTAIGDALALGIKHLQHTPESQRILVLLTDGVSNVGLDPNVAKEVAIKAKVKVYPIAFGHNNVTIDTAFGPRQYNLPLDEDLLKDLAEKTGGLYFRAEDTKALKKVYQTLNEIEEINYDAKIIRPIHEWYYIPLMITFALICLILLRKLMFAAISRRRLKKKAVSQVRLEEPGL